MDSNLHRRANARVVQSRKLLAETRRHIENARLLIDCQRRRASMQVKEVNDVVLVSGIASQEKALNLCRDFQKWGVKSSIGMLPGVAGYHVLIYRVGLAEAKAMLAELGIEMQ